MNAEQRENLEAVLRRSPIPVGSGVSEQRRLLRERASARPAPAEVTVTPAEPGGVPAADITIDGIEPRYVVLFFHGGVYVLGDASNPLTWPRGGARRAPTRVISLDYRLAPSIRTRPRSMTLLPPMTPSCERAPRRQTSLSRETRPGAGLAVATMANARDHGLPLPAAAFLMSPYADLTLGRASMDTKSDVDPLLSRELLQPRVTDYTAGQDPRSA